MHTIEAKQTGHTEKVRSLNHDIKNHLFVLGMGLQTLEAIRSDPDQFREVLETIENEGLEPLKQSIQELVLLARNASDASA